MKNIFFYIAASFIILAGCTPRYSATAPPPQPQQEETETAPEPVTYQEFYDDLSPYGRWINYPNDGYVWSPNVDADFKPYTTNGHWVYSNEGWTWVSDYQWGWAPFHYGNWFYDDSYGWLWLPGTQWAPAWVTWGQSGGYYGWAPIPPHVDIRSGWMPSERQWTFVPQEHITRPQISNYVVDKSTNVNIVKNVTIINNIHNNTTNNVTNNVNTNTVNNRNTTNNNITNTNETNNTVNNRNTNTNVNNNTVIKAPNPANNTASPANNDNRILNNMKLANVKNTHNTTVVNRGPQLSQVTQVASAPVTKVNIKEANAPMKPTMASNNRLIMYRPVVKPFQQQPNEMRPVPKTAEPFAPSDQQQRNRK